jgi:hypothetical protein
MTEPLDGYHHSPEENVALDWLITFSIFALPAFIIPGVYFYFSFPSAKKFYEKEVSKETFSSRYLM